MFEKTKESGGKSYNIQIHIEVNKLFIEIESESKHYMNKYDLEQLKVFEYFNGSKNLEDAFEDLKDLLDNNYSLTETENNIELLFPRRRGDVKLLLNKIGNNLNIKYQLLSEKMKNIIDNNELVLGIDLGTTSSCASVMLDNEIIVIRDSLGSKQTPSYINFINKNKIYVGTLAKLLPSDEKNVIYHIKRLIGKSYKEEEIEELKNNFPYSFKKDSETDLLKIELVFKKQAEEKENSDKINAENEIINTKEENETININEGDNIINVKEENNIINMKEENEIININEESDIKEEKEKKEINEIKEEKEINLENYIVNENKEEEKEEFYPEEIYSLILKKIIIDSEYYLTKYLGKKINIKNVVITVPAYFNQKQREATLNAAKIIDLNIITMINEPTAAILPYVYNKKESDEKYIVVIDFGGGTLDITLLKFIKDEEKFYCDILTTHGDTNFGGEDFDKILMEKCIKKCIKNSPNSRELFQENGNLAHNARLKRACERAKIKLSYLESTQIHMENYYNYQTINIHLTRDKFLGYCKTLFNRFEQKLNEFILLSKIKEKKIDVGEVILIGGTTLMPKIKEIIKLKFAKSVIKSDLNPKEVVSMGAAIRGAIYSNLTSVNNIILFDVTNISLGIKEFGDTFKKVIERNSKIPCKNTDIFKTSKDNQTSALVEIYEGESETNCKEKNLFLGKFKLSGITPRKAGESKIKVEFKIDQNSILEVKAWERDNKINCFNSIKIEKPFELDIKALKKRIKEFSFFENEEYNKIKNSIRELTEELNNPNHNNFEEKKNIYRKRIVILGEFVLEILEPSNLYISFIKYYFNILCEFYQLFYSNDDEKEIKNEIALIKDDIKTILEKIQFYNPDLIYEIIEEFVDLDDLYKSCVQYILKSYWDKLNLVFYSSKTIMMEKKVEQYNKVLKELFDAKYFAKICLDILKKYKEILDSKLIFTEKDFNDIILKIEVREEIIRARKMESISDEIKNQLRNKFNIYRQSNIYEFEDLKELGLIIGEDVLQNEDIIGKTIENYEKEFDKAAIFLKWIQEQNVLTSISPNELYKILRKIITDYPYCGKSEKEKDEMWNLFHTYKERGIPFSNFAITLREKYNVLRKDIPDKDQNIKYDIYSGIIEFLQRF